jgi:hypothetical protein
MKITVMNQTTHASGIWWENPTATMVVNENADGVPAFPDAETDTKFAYTLDGSAIASDALPMGLYKLEKKAGNELQFKMTGLPALSNPVFNVKFLSCWDQSIPCKGTNLYGVAATSWGSNSFEFDNSTVTYSVSGQYAWDSVKVWEVPVFNDMIYVLITSLSDWTGMGQQQAPLGNARNWNLAGGNSTGFTLNYLEEPFLKNKEEFIVSRENTIQCYDIALGPCASAQLEAIYGRCCSVSASFHFINKKWNAVNAIAATDALMAMVTVDGIKAPLPLCIKSAATYIVLTNYGATTYNGSILKLTIWNISISIPGYSVFFTTLAVLGIVAALIVKRKQH